MAVRLSLCPVAERDLAIAADVETTHQHGDLHDRTTLIQVLGGMSFIAFRHIRVNHTPFGVDVPGQRCSSFAESTLCRVFVLLLSLSAASSLGNFSLPVLPPP